MISISRRIAAVAGVGALASIGFAGIANAAGPPNQTAQATATATVSQSASLSLTSNSIPFGSIVPGASGNATDGWTINDNDPSGWALMINSTDFTGGGTIPAGDMTVSDSDSGSGAQALTNANAQLDEGGQGAHSGTDSYVLNVPGSQNPGSYSATVTYTLVSS
jgi:hypothetical protein